MDLAQQTNKLKEWLSSYVNVTHFLPIPGDASARHYFRVTTNSDSFIAVVAPPQTENNSGFVAIAQSLKRQGLIVPDVHHVDYDHGYLLLSDLGDSQLLKVLNEQNVQRYYQQALEELLKLQTCTEFGHYQPPHFSHELLFEELKRFDDWYLTRHLGIELTSAEVKLLHDTYAILIEHAVAQPQVFVHRDYHSRNIMVVNDGLGLLDFQDGVIGPLSYDLVSLLRDCYIKWPTEQTYQWVTEFWQLLPQQYKTQTSLAEFIQFFDWMGLQRHLKVLGIFARLYQRDGKHIYLADIPRILEYVLHVCDQYQPLQEFKNFLKTRVLFHESNDISGRKREAAASFHG